MEKESQSYIHEDIDGHFLLCDVERFEVKQLIYREDILDHLYTPVGYSEDGF